MKSSQESPLAMIADEASRMRLAENLGVQHSKPKILLLDVENAVSSAVRSEGLSATVGSLGRPYKVKQNDIYQSLVGTAKAPNLMEHEIVVVDLLIKEVIQSPEGEQYRASGELDITGKCNKGFLDPRPRTAEMWRGSFERIRSAGGAFVVFADKRTHIDLQVGRTGDSYSWRPFSFDAWAFLKDLSNIQVNDDEGEEINLALVDSPVTSLIKKHLGRSRFTCSFKADEIKSQGWTVLATNKFGVPVSLARCEGRKGTLLVFPQIKDKAAFLSELMTTVLPEIAPHLFPHLEGSSWTRQPQYELPLITQLRTRQEEARKKADEEIAELATEIDNEREKNGWLHDLIIGTDVVLVGAVKKALAALGFEKVVDVDEERDQKGRSRREDLQIHDATPVLIVDVKGLSGHPSDSDANQSFKHATLRSREWQRFDVQALTLINHQRHIPPLGRDNAMPFRQELLEIAEEHEMGLITSWDLHRLVRSALRWQWKPAHTRPIFYRKGRIDIVPGHYVLLGTVAHVYPEAGAASIQVDAEGLMKGCRIAFELDVEFEEQEVDSLQVDKAAVKTAPVGVRAGVKTTLDRSSLKEGTRVFLVRP